MVAIRPEKSGRSRSAENKKADLEERCKEFADTTTLHGVSHYHYAGEKSRQIFWGIVLFLTCTMIATEVGFVIKDYVTHPTTTSVTTTPVTEIQLPDLVLCTKHRLSKTFVDKNAIPLKLVEYMNSVFSERQVFELNITAGAIDSLDLEYQKLKARLGADNMTDIFEMGMVECEDVFIKCMYHGKDLEDGCCSNVEVTMMAGGPCFALAADNLTSHHPGPAKQYHGGPGYGFTFVLDLQPSELVGTIYNTDISYGLDIHVGHPHLDHEPLPFDNNKLSAPPGSHAHVQLSKIITDRTTGCHKASKITGLRYFPKYDAQACLYECMINASVHFCDCAPLGHDVAQKADKICEPMESMSCYRPRMYDVNYQLATDEQVTEMSDYIKACSKTCKLSCHSTEYKGNVVYGTFPSPAAVAELQEHRELLDLDTGNVTNRYVMLTAYFTDMAYQYVNEVSTASINTLVSNIGGQLGLFSGCSFITLIHMVSFWIFRWRQKTE